MDTLQLIEQKRIEFSSRFTRMDEDKDLLYRKPYVMLDNSLKGKPIPDVHNVTLPLASIFSGRIVALLSTANKQVEIESDKMSDTATTDIEKFDDALAYAIDNYLADQGEQDMALTQWERACNRGWLGGRCCLREENGELIPDVLPLDMRYVLFEYTRSGLSWVAPESVRSGAAIEEEYKIPFSALTGKVTDFWNKKVNEVYIDGEMIFDQKNPYGYPPFVIQPIPAGSNLKDQESAKHRGESIFAFVRDMYKEANRFATIDATLTEMSFTNHLQYASKLGEGATAPSTPELNKRMVYPVDIGGGFKGMPLEDTHRAATMWWQIIQEIVQMATISNISYGTLQWPLSGVAISSMTSAQDKIMVPRLQGYALYERALTRMKIRQMIEGKITAELGEEGHKKKWSYTQLKGDYSIKYRFSTVSKEQMIANAAIANSMGNSVSEDYKKREIFKLQNPDEEKRKVDHEKLDATHPLISRWHMIEYLYEDDKDLEGDILLEELLMLIRSGQLTPAMPEAKAGNPADLIPLLGAGGGPSRPPAEEA